MGIEQFLQVPFIAQEFPIFPFLRIYLFEHFVNWGITELKIMSRRLKSYINAKKYAHLDSIFGRILPFKKLKKREKEK